jgi:N4-gp56 family major capsid protein
MGSKTSIPYGHPMAKVVQAAGLFTAHMARNTTMNRLTGKMPTQAETEGTLRKQTSSHYPIVRAMDLGKKMGDEIEFDLLNPVGGKPIMGGENAEGRGVGMSFSQDRLRVNQARFPISAGDTMSQIRSPHELRTLARASAQSFMDRYGDQSILTHLAGARGFHNNIEWAVPLASDPDFAKIMVNPVKAPTKNRHYMSTGSGIEAFAQSAGDMSIATTDVFNMSVVDGIRTVMDTIALPPPPVIFEGDKAATDSPLRVLLVSPPSTAVSPKTAPSASCKQARWPAHSRPTCTPCSGRSWFVERHPDRQDAQADPLPCRRHREVLRERTPARRNLLVWCPASVWYDPRG